MSVRVLFVCLGNICRSPTAHGVFQSMVDSRGLSDQVIIDSAGTGDWHLNHAPDARAQKAAADRGYDLSMLRARLVTPEDFTNFNIVVAMDDSNLKNLQAMKPDNYQGKLVKLLDYHNGELTEVPDPYTGGADQFDEVLNLVESACEQLLNSIETTLKETSY